MINRTLKTEERKETKLIFYKREKCTNFYIELEFRRRRRKNVRKIRVAEVKFVRNEEMYQVGQI
jgi:hypothetical protein